MKADIGEVSRPQRASCFTADSFTTALELESQLPDGDDLVELADDAANYTGVVAWYRDEKTGKQDKVTAGDQARPRRLTHLYQSKASAKRAVDREWGRVHAPQHAL